MTPSADINKNVNIICFAIKALELQMITRSESVVLFNIKRTTKNSLYLEYSLGFVKF